jgi:hypothetical protein
LKINVSNPLTCKCAIRALETGRNDGGTTVYQERYPNAMAAE